MHRRHENGRIVLERQTLHVMNGAQRIAMVETKTVDSSGPIANGLPRIRFQCSNHLDSVNLELDEFGGDIVRGVSSVRDERVSGDKRGD